MNRNLINGMLAAALITAGLATGCHKTEVTPLNDPNRPLIIDGKDYTTWQFIEDVSRECYLWSNLIPKKLTYSRYATPLDFFNKAIRHKDDRFSTVVDNYEEMNSYFDNEMVSDGLNLELYIDDAEAGTVIGVVNYVYENTPAYGSGLKRGDVVRKIDGQTITLDNYNDLLDLPQCIYSYSHSYQNDDGSYDFEDEMQNTAVIAKTNCKIEPVLVVKSGEVMGRRYGYLAYDAFTEDTKTIMDAVAKLQENDPEALILDLRLNGGGYVSTLDTLASMLVPDGNVGKVFLESTYNEEMTEYYKKIDGPDFAYERFVDIQPKLNLNTLYVIISGNSASASEELISGLMPYMNIVLIGEQSYGKFTSNILLNNDMDGVDDNGIPYRNWAEYVSIGSCRNALGEMNFKDGFKPDFEIEDPIFGDLGHEREPLMETALLMMSGSISKRATACTPSHGLHIGSHGKPEITKGAMIMNPKRRASNIR